MNTSKLSGSAVCAILAAANAQSPPPAATSMPPTLTLQQAVQTALADAGRRTGLAIDMLQVDSAAAVTWRDGALGCPQPGFAYTQALVSGYRVRIRASGQPLDYHAGLRGPVVLCPADRAEEPLSDDDARK
jgi:hypothetical protein